MNILTTVNQVLDSHIVELYCQGNSGKVHGVLRIDQSKYIFKSVNMDCWEFTCSMTMGKDASRQISTYITTLSYTSLVVLPERHLRNKMALFSI